MDDPAIWIALASLVVTVVGYVLNVRAIRHEQKYRKEELSLLRRQVEAEASARGEQRRARLVADYGGGGGTSGNRVQFVFDMTNTGPAVARDVAIWPGRSDGEPVGAIVHVGAALLRETKTRTAVETPIPVGRQPGLLPFARWVDDAGEHEEAIAELPPY